ncbi:Protein diaphanous -like protein 2 [Takifugu flavidus]|uniref:Protein diaphanous-like protein 2 n=1 Tax=Takifugu flavidus TaxID=433684 RepID=A0A5C6MPE2_9TELE|nr:Protein diaphanous -like protein 2 [Takifugu flavidus]
MSSSSLRKTYAAISAASCLISSGGLRNSKHEFTLSSQEYVHELRSGITEEKLFHCLESLRVSLTSNPVSPSNPTPGVKERRDLNCIQSDEIRNAAAIFKLHQRKELRASKS